MESEITQTFYSSESSIRQTLISFRMKLSADNENSRQFCMYKCMI